MKLDLASARAKQRRAKEHLDALKNEISSRVNAGIYTAIKTVNADRTRYSIILRIREQVPFESFAMIAGDCIHNLRSALDHLVYAIAVHESKQNPPPKESRLAFVIGNEPNDFKGFREKIRSLSDGVQAAIESVQPYNRRHQDLPPLLALLHDFDIADKHKLLQVCFAAIHQGHFGNIKNVPIGQPVRIGITMKNLEDGAEIASMTFDRPMPNVTYNWEGDILVAILHKPGPTGIEISELYAVLAMLQTEVDDVIGIVSAAVT